MLKCAVLVTILAVYASGMTEKAYGTRMSFHILSYYNDQLQVLPIEYERNIRKFLAHVEETATRLSAAAGKCVRDGAEPVEKSLNEEVKLVFAEQADKVAESLSSLSDLDDEGVDKLWTSVSTNGTFRDEVNAAITSLKSSLLQKLNSFKEEITQKCRPKEKAETLVLQKLFG